MLRFEPLLKNCNRLIAIVSSQLEGMATTSTTIIGTSVIVKITASVKLIILGRGQYDARWREGANGQSSLDGLKSTIFMTITIFFKRFTRVVGEETIGLGTNRREAFIFHVSGDLSVVREKRMEQKMIGEVDS